MNDQIQQLHASIAKIEAQLYAIGSGGVGASIQPPVQADTAQAPVAWRVHPFDYGVGPDGVYALTMRTEQVEMWQRKGWKVEPLYTAPQPDRQPLTDEQITEAFNKAMGQREKEASNAETNRLFARAIEEAVWKQHMASHESNKELLK